MTEIEDQAFPAGKEDEWLAVRCQLGERAAFDELIERYQGPLWRYVRRVAPDEDAAREVTQDAWLRVIRGIGRLRDPARLRPWLFGIARRGWLTATAATAPDRSGPCRPTFHLTP